MNEAQWRLWLFRVCFVINLALVSIVYFLVLVLLLGWALGEKQFEIGFSAITFVFGTAPLTTWRWAVANKDELLQGKKPNIFSWFINVIKSPWNNQNNRQRLLYMVETYWIEGVLRPALVADTLHELTGQPATNLVTPRFARKSGFAELGDKQSLTSEKDILTLFEASDRALLILGAPGSGKTVVLLELVQALIALARDSRNLHVPLPVVLNLSSWKSKDLSFYDWLIHRLRLEYAISKRFAKQLIENGQLIYMLDGLDEVDIEYRKNCLQAIDRFWQTYGFKSSGIAIASRTKEYELMEWYLKLDYAIELQPLRLTQVYEFVESLGVGWKGLLKALEDKTVKELIESPLLLNIMVNSYYNIPHHVIASFMHKDDQINDLFERYIEISLRTSLHQSHISLKEAKKYLSSLARKMTAYNISIFYPNNINSIWLTTRFHIALYSLLSALLFTLAFTIMSGYIIGRVASFLTNQSTYIGILLGETIGMIIAIVSFIPYFRSRSRFATSVNNFVITLILNFWDKDFPLKRNTFLNNMVRANILRRVGTGFIFRHRLLLQYFLNFVTEFKPRTAREYYETSSAFLEIKEYESALTNINEAIRLNPKEMLFYITKIHAYYGQGDFTSAISVLDRRIELEPKEATYYESRARNHVRLGNYVSALDDFTSAIELQRQNSEYFYQRGRVYIKLADYKSAWDDFADAIHLESMNGECFYWFALTGLITKHDRADDFWDRTRQFMIPSIKDQCARDTKLARMALVSGELTEARKLFSRLIEEGILSDSIKDEQEHLQFLREVFPDNQKIPEFEEWFSQEVMNITGRKSHPIA